MKSKVDLVEIVKQLKYIDYYFKLDNIDDDHYYLQCVWIGKDTTTGVVGTQKGRKWFVSPHMTETEVVQTALKAVLTVVEHEVRELFSYRGFQVFNPHMKVDLLAAASTLERDGRDEPNGKRSESEARTTTKERGVQEAESTRSRDQDFGALTQRVREGVGREVSPSSNGPIAGDARTELRDYPTE